jgi:hypothetical protein
MQSTYRGRVEIGGVYLPQSTHRVAPVAFWRTFHHDGKISPGLVRVGGARPPPFAVFTITYEVAVYAPAEWADTLPLFHLYPYMYYVVSTLSAGTYTTTLHVMVDIVKRGGRASSTLIRLSDFSIMMECTPKSGHCHSVSTLWGRAKEKRRGEQDMSSLYC